MYLYFENSYGQRRVIGEPKTSEESFKIISNFCKERNFEIPYMRTWTNAKGEKYYDVSSHTEFFIEVEDELYDGDK